MSTQMNDQPVQGSVTGAAGAGAPLEVSRDVGYNMALSVGPLSSMLSAELTLACQVRERSADNMLVRGVCLVQAVLFIHRFAEPCARAARPGRMQGALKGDPSLRATCVPDAELYKRIWVGCLVNP